MKRIARAIKRGVVRVGLVVQRAILLLLLTLLYVFGFGPTRALATLFRSRLVRRRAPANSPSYFVPAQGYEVSLRQGHHGS